MIDKEVQAREREKIMQECIALSKEYTHLVIELSTGVGKGRICASIIRASDSTKKWVVLVPEKVQIVNFKLDLAKHGNEDLLETHIEDVICYASVDKLEGKSVNIHLNESHRVSQHRMDILKTVNFDQIISDSATINEEIENRLHDIHPFHKYTKSLQEVIDIGILPQPEIVCIGIELSPIQRKEYDKLCKTIELWDNRYNQQGQEWQRIKYLNAGSARKRWLSTAKTTRSKALLVELEQYRLICFCGSVSQAKELGGKQAIYGTNKNNQDIIDKYNSEKENKLYTCMMMQEGQNLYNTEKGVIIQLDGTDRTFIQRSGRILRGEEPIIYILYIENTRDESYLKTAINSLDQKHIKYIT